MDFVILPTDSRYDPGHRYQNANVHLDIWLKIILCNITQFPRSEQNHRLSIFTQILQKMEAMSIGY